MSKPDYEGPFEMLRSPFYYTWKNFEAVLLFIKQYLVVVLLT